MVKRHGKSSFMANAYVYPGGKLDPADCTGEASAYCSGLSAAEALAVFEPQGERLPDDAQISEEEALGLHIAAIREVFEESGALLAHREGGATVGLEDPAVQERFRSHQAKLHAGEMSMTELAREEGLLYPLDGLRYFAHWITPDVERRRFNTRFFLAKLPQGQEPIHDEKEVVASSWLSPTEALALYNTNAIQLAPPTLCTLEEMSLYASVEALFEGMLAHPVATILPRLESLEGGGAVLLLPGDPLYPSAAGVRRGATRVELTKGRWWAKREGGER